MMSDTLSKIGVAQVIDHIRSTADSSIDNGKSFMFLFGYDSEKKKVIFKYVDGEKEPPKEWNLVNKGNRMQVASAGGSQESEGDNGHEVQSKA